MGETWKSQEGLKDSDVYPIKTDIDFNNMLITNVITTITIKPRGLYKHWTA
ncbi:MAG: hypothetical protein ACI828_002653 [Flavobacteriales bacterium]|jgi:hypothetical protein